ncbi:MAG: alpha/beta hydrolase [Nanoarchaeota archaeon]|nr:alpha/beta hydrolase [Nanoarchaeota archaeon]MBU1103935.1 alpha/beta hydrolase [Nanoarchaeota archaeon]
MKFFIIHGSYGSPKENWFPWLKERLEEEGNNVFVPEFPTPNNQSLDNWMKVFDDFYSSEVGEDSIFIGHSLGPAFILSILERLNIKVKACFFVSGFLGLLGNPEFDEVNKTFIAKEFDWERIRKNCENFYVYHSDNDPYVSLEKAKELAEKLGTEVIIVKNAGHFNESSGYLKFELLLKDIEIKCGKR